MATRLSSILKNTPPYQKLDGKHGYIIQGSICRMVRNLNGHPFPGWSREEDRAAVQEAVQPALMELPGMKGAFVADMTGITLEERRLLLLRKQLSPCMAARQSGCQLLIPRKQDKVFFINEEEHIVCHFFQAGLQLRELLKAAEKTSRQLQEKLPLAYQPDLGYLGSIPSECGDGIQLYGIMHLPAINMIGQMNRIKQGLEAMDLSIAPYLADQQNGTGNLFVLFSLPAESGKTEEALENLERAILSLERRERQLRYKMRQDAPLEQLDRIARAYALLGNARLLEYHEMLQGLSQLMLDLEEQRELSDDARLLVLQSMVDMRHMLSNSYLRYKFKQSDDMNCRAKRADATRDFLLLLESIF